MQGLQIGQFGRFVFTMEKDSQSHPFDIEGTEIKEMDHHHIWLEDLEGVVYNVKKMDVKLFEEMERK